MGAGGEVGCHIRRSHARVDYGLHSRPALRPARGAGSCTGRMEDATPMGASRTERCGSQGSVVASLSRSRT
jgi:hypothetical protein